MRGSEDPQAVYIVFLLNTNANYMMISQDLKSFIGIPLSIEGLVRKDLPSLNVDEQLRQSAYCASISLSH